MPSSQDVLPQTVHQYPTKSKDAVGTIDGKVTKVACTAFTDKLMVTIMQDGRLAQWIQVSLENPNPTFADERLPSSDEDNLLPMTHLTPKTLLGASTSDRETLGQLYATQIASAIITRNPDERRSLLIGLSLSESKANKSVFYETIDLVLHCL